MKGYTVTLEKQTIDNTLFRRVLYTAKHSQLVLMALKPGEDIGLEIHTDSDQFFRFEKGQGKVTIDDNQYTVTDGDAVIVPSGAEHNIENTSKTELLQFYTIYTPPHHKDSIVRITKKDAEEHEAEFDGITSE